MKTITPAEILNQSIQRMEVEQSDKLQMLKNELSLAYESVKPVNMIKNAFRDITSSSVISDSILGTVAGMAAGYLSKKIFTGTSVNLLRKLFGSILQLGVTNVVSSHPEAVKTLGQFVFHLIRHKKEMKAKNSDKQ